MIIIDDRGFRIKPWKEKHIGIPLKEATRWQAGLLWISSIISAIYGTPLIVWLAVLDLVVEFVVAIGIVQRRKRYLKWYPTWLLLLGVVHVIDGIVQFGGAPSKCVHDSRSSNVDRGGLPRDEWEKQCEINTRVLAALEFFVFLVSTGLTSGLAWSYNCHLYETNQWTKTQDIMTVVDELERETRQKYERRKLRMMERAKIEKASKKKKSKKKKSLRQRTPPNPLKKSVERPADTQIFNPSILDDTDQYGIEITR